MGDLEVEGRAGGVTIAKMMGFMQVSEEKVNRRKIDLPGESEFETVFP